MFFLRELKEEGLIITNWIKGGDNPVDLFTKNLFRGSLLEKMNILGKCQSATSRGGESVREQNYYAHRLF